MAIAAPYPTLSLSIDDAFLHGGGRKDSGYGSETFDGYLHTPFVTERN